MNKNLLAVLIVGTVFFVAGCACGKNKKACPMMDTMKNEEMAKTAEEAAPAAVEAVVNAEAPAVNAEAPAVNAEVPAMNAEMPMAK